MIWHFQGYIAAEACVMRTINFAHAALLIGHQAKPQLVDVKPHAPVPVANHNDSELKLRVVRPGTNATRRRLRGYYGNAKSANGQ